MKRAVWPTDTQRMLATCALLFRAVRGRLTLGFAAQNGQRRTIALIERHPPKVSVFVLGTALTARVSVMFLYRGSWWILLRDSSRESRVLGTLGF